MSAPQGVQVWRTKAQYLGGHFYSDERTTDRQESGRWFPEREAEILIAVFEAAMQQSMVRGTPIKMTWKDDPS